MRTVSFGVPAAWCSEFLGTKLHSCHVIVDPFREWSFAKKTEIETVWTRWNNDVGLFTSTTFLWQHQAGLEAPSVNDMICGLFTVSYSPSSVLLFLRGKLRKRLRTFNVTTSANEEREFQSARQAQHSTSFCPFKIQHLNYCWRHFP